MKLTGNLKEPEKIQASFAALKLPLSGGYEQGYADGKAQAVKELPEGYIKIDPSWTNLSNLCSNRASLAENLKYSDTANGRLFNNMFASCPAKRIPSLDLRKATNVYGLFVSCSAEEIGELDISSITSEPAMRDMFKNCNYLKKVCFVPGCIKFDISFVHCSKLEDSAVQSIIDGLADLTGQTAQTLTLHPTVGARLTAEQKAAIAAKNWSVVY